MIRKAYVFGGGVFFAMLQFSYFVLLEWQLSSAWTTYMTVTLSWMLGIIAGLWFGMRYAVSEKWLQFLNIPVYYGLWCGLSWRPFDNTLLILYAFCVFVSGACAGRFFVNNVARMGDARKFLLYENNGFITGLLAGFLFFSFAGKWFLAVVPLTAVLLLAVNFVFLPSE